MRGTHAVIYLPHLRHNLREIRRRVGEGRMVCAAVKADAYGHGAVRVGRVLVEEGVEMLGVATPEEGAELVEAGVGARVLLLGLTDGAGLELAVEAGVELAVGDREYVREVVRVARAKGRRVRVHVEVDTGMGRTGCAPEEAVGVVEEVEGAGVLELAGMWTHFPSSDEADDGFTEAQVERFLQVVGRVRARGISPGLLHAANSGGIIGHPPSWLDMVRPGISLYGYYPSEEQERTLSLLPVMEFVSQVVFLKKVRKGTPVSYGRTWRAPRDTWIATVAAGYADGYSRLLSSRAEVLIRGRRYPVVGRVCMDQFMVDVGPHLEVARYDRVVLFGPDPAGPSAEELARLVGTIPYEITCAVSRRVPRVYVEESPYLSGGSSSAHRGGLTR